MADVKKITFENVPKPRRFPGYCNTNETFYMFGGKVYEPLGYVDELWSLNLITMNWNKLNPINDNIPKGRYGCSLNYYDGKLYVFGGYLGKLIRNDLWTYDLIGNVWNQVNILETDTKPPDSQYHRTVVYKSYIILFGGINYIKPIRKKCCYNDIYVLNMKTNKWRSVECANKPFERRSHSMVLINGNIVIYGGANASNKVLNDCYVINARNIINGGSCYWNKIDIQFDPLFAHSMISDSKYMLCFGGNSIHGSKNGVQNNKMTRFINVNAIIEKNSLSTFLSGYIRGIEKELTINIPVNISMIIETFIGIIMESNILDIIDKKAGVSMSIFSNNGQTSLFLFGGYIYSSAFKRTDTNDGHIISLK